MAENQPAYRAISDSVRRDIIERRLLPGDRLPVETELAEHFGVSRSTIREVLRDLTSQNLVETTRGATGGTFVVVPQPDAMARSLGVGITMLANSDTLSVAQMLEAREILEVPLARLATERASEAAVDEICAHCDVRLERRAEGRDLESNWGFHSLVAKAAGNPLLELMAEPVFHVLETRFSTIRGSNNFAQNIELQHQEIARRMKERDVDGCADAMREHLDFLRPYYRKFDARLSAER